MHTYPLLLAMMVWASPALAQNITVKKHVKAAVGLYENLEYEKALQQLKNAQKVTAKGPDDEVNIALLEGVVLADMGREEKALAAFKTAFSIDNAAGLPLDVSPKVAALAERARASMKKVLAPAVAFQKAEEERRKRDETALAAPPPQAADAAPEASVQGAGLTPPPPPPEVLAAQPREPGSNAAGWSARSLSWVPGLVGLAAGGVGTGLLVSAGAKRAALLNGTAPPEQAAAYRDEGNQQATIGYLMIGVAAAGVGTAVAMFALGGRSPAQVSAVPIPGGAVVLMGWSLDVGAR